MLGFFQQFSSNFENQIQGPDQTKNRKILNFNASPLTKKQLQLEEFTINLKENKIK